MNYDFWIWAFQTYLTGIPLVGAGMLFAHIVHRAKTEGISKIETNKEQANV